GGPHRRPLQDRLPARHRRRRQARRRAQPAAGDRRGGQQEGQPMNTLVSRRRLLAATAIVPAAVVLNACKGLTASQVAAQAVQDVKLIASGLAGALPSLGTAANIPAATVALIGQTIANIQTVADGVAQAASNIDAQPLVQQLE